MLKEAAVGGPSLVFIRFLEIGVTGLRVHQFPAPKLCRKILGFDTNALYLSTKLEDVPCGQEQVACYFGAEAAAALVLTQRLKARTWFGFAEVDIEIPEPLWLKFEQVPTEAVQQHMLDYLWGTGRARAAGEKLVGALSAEKMLLYTPLLR